MNKTFLRILGLIATLAALLITPGLVAAQANNRGMLEAALAQTDTATSQATPAAATAAIPTVPLNTSTPGGDGSIVHIVGYGQTLEYRDRLRGEDRRYPQVQ